jgi:excisionase family DNA binding protein
MRHANSLKGERPGALAPPPQTLRKVVQEPVTLIDINELSRRISVPKGTIYQWVYLRRIPFIKAGRSLRFDADEVIQSMPHSDKLDLAGRGRRRF